jgi:hypothetical protein
MLIKVVEGGFIRSDDSNVITTFFSDIMPILHSEIVVDNAGFRRVNKIVIDYISAVHEVIFVFV